LAREIREIKGTLTLRVLQYSGTSDWFTWLDNCEP